MTRVYAPRGHLNRTDEDDDLPQYHGQPQSSSHHASRCSSYDRGEVRRPYDDPWRRVPEYRETQPRDATPSPSREGSSRQPPTREGQGRGRPNNTTRQPSPTGSYERPRPRPEYYSRRPGPVHWTVSQRGDSPLHDPYVTRSDGRSENIAWSEEDFEREEATIRRDRRRAQERLRDINYGSRRSRSRARHSHRRHRSLSAVNMVTIVPRRCPLRKDECDRDCFGDFADLHPGDLKVENDERGMDYIVGVRRRH